MNLRSEGTVMAVSNAIALTAAVVQSLAGNAIANTLNNSELSNAALHDIIGSHINKTFSNFTNQRVQS